ncbi:MAG: hypothetical protein WDW38_002715 [Sanguina aurantia]
MENKDSGKQVHLLILQHGLWGTASNLDWLEQLIQKEYAASASPSLRVLNSRVNEKNLTYDGVDICGTRVASLVQDTVASLAAQGQTVTHLSFVGYSLGGLYNRYAVGKLWAEGFFDAVVPLNFCTIATPHVGSWRDPVTKLARVFNYLLPTMGSRSGTQLMLQDSHAWGKPLLCLMAQPELPFMKALGQFKKLMLMANVQNDRSVPYCTASISLVNSFEAPGVVVESFDPRFPSLVHIASSEKLHPQPNTPSTPTAASSSPITPALADNTRSPPTLSQSNPGHSPSQPEPPLQLPRVLKLEGQGSEEASALVPLSGAGKVLPLRPVAGGWVILIFIVLLPLALPALGVMLLKGISHHKAWKKRSDQPDCSWLERWFQRTTAVKAPAGEDGSSQQQRRRQEQQRERGKQSILESVPTVEHVSGPLRDVVLDITGEDEENAFLAEAGNHPPDAAAAGRRPPALSCCQRCVGRERACCRTVDWWVA